MIKYIAILSLILFFFTSCGEDIEELGVDENGVANNFIVSGTVEGVENTTFYLESISKQGNIVIAEAKSDASGKFTMQGNISNLGMFQLRMGEESDEKIIPLTLVPNDKVKITSNFTNYATTPKLKGTNWAPVMTEYMTLISDFNTNKKELISLKGTVSNKDLTERFLVMKGVIDNFALASMEKKPSNAFNIILSSHATPTMGFENWDSNNLKVLKGVSDAYASTYKDSPIASTLTNQVAQIEAAYNQQKSNNSGKRIAPEIVLKKPDGSDIRLSQLRGKYVMIDFWASCVGLVEKKVLIWLDYTMSIKVKDLPFSLSLWIRMLKHGKLLSRKTD